MEKRTRTEEEALVQSALAGDPAAIRELVRYLTPTVQAVVARYVWAWKRHTRVTEITAARDELYQEVMMQLFAKDRQALRRYEPEQASLKTYVSRIAAYTCGGLVKSTTLEVAPNEEDTADASPSAARIVEDRQLLTLLYDRLTETLSPLDFAIFRLLFVEERSYEEVEAETGLHRKALHMRKYRIKAKANDLLTELCPPSASTAKGGSP